MEDTLLEPLKGYNSVYKEKHKQNVIEYFDDLTNKARTDVAGNKKTVDEYKKVLKEIENLGKRIKRNKILFGILIIILFVSTAFSIYFMIDFFKQKNIGLGILFIFVILLLLVGGFFLLNALRKKIAKLSNLYKELKKKADELLALAWSQMASLNALYDWNTAAMLVTKTIPLIEMDQYFDSKKFDYLNSLYGFKENECTNISTYDIQSGSILGNPFLLCRDYRQDWVNKKYIGSITIHWTTSSYSNGKRTTVNHSQTLTAEVVKPVPKYSYETYLVYGNGAAPNLRFSRSPSGASGISDKDLEKRAKRDSKKFDKLAKEALMDNDPTTNYTKLGNDKFESLFGGTNRTNEREFRLLFTPLAQKNLIDIIKTKEPFGDDFYFQKDLELNYIESMHSQKMDYWINPTYFLDYDYEAAKKRFIEYNMKYFESFYFDIAPLLSIPLYQQYKTKEYIYKENYESNIANHEHESMANSFNPNLLRPNNANTPSILKTKFVRKNGCNDTVNVTAHAFRACKKVTYFNKMGMDGRMHTIPVYWIDYVPVQRETLMAVEPKQSSRYEFNNIKNNQGFKNFMNNLSMNNAYHYRHGLFAFLLLHDITKNDVDGINSIYKGSQNIDIKTSAASKKSLEEILRDIEEELDKKDDIEINNDSLLNDDSNAEEIKEEDLDKYNPIKDDEDVLDLEDEENEENEN